MKIKRLLVGVVVGVTSGLIGFASLPACDGCDAKGKCAAKEGLFLSFGSKVTPLCGAEPTNNGATPARYSWNAGGGTCSCTLAPGTTGYNWSGCKFEGGGATGSDSSSGGKAAFCYKRLDGEYCECYDSDHSSGLPTTDYAAVKDCTPTTVSSQGVCCATLDSSQSTDYCQCLPIRCVLHQDKTCNCASGLLVESDGQDVATCGPSGAITCCASDDQTKCVCETGCDQSSGVHAVTSCKTANVVPLEVCKGRSDTTSTASCAGLAWH